MSYIIRPMASQKFELQLKGEPVNCHALAMQPREREPDLNHGPWLVLVFAVWSGPDRNAIETALQLGREFVEKLQVGIRPFDKKEELQSWCPEAKVEWVSPTWLVLQDGKLMHEMFGPHSAERLREALAVSLGEK